MRDVAKIAAAVSRPGIDPRSFVDLAVVRAVAVDADGVHADVVVMNDARTEETAVLSSPYAGPGYGAHFPVELDDAVVLATPDGKFNAGARIVGRSWDRGMPIPSEVIEAPEDVVIVVKPGQSIRIVVSGGGNAVIEAREGGTVRLGQAEAAGEPQVPLMTVDDGATWMDALAAAIAQVGPLTPAAIPLAALFNALGGSPAAIPTTPPTPPTKEWPTGALNVTARPSKLEI